MYLRLFQESCIYIAIEIKFLHAKIFHGCKKLKSGATKLEALYCARNVLCTCAIAINNTKKLLN